jgi:hypothetical protein
MNNQTLVVFYSHTGTSRRAAQLLASQFGWQTGEVSDRHPRVGTAGTFKCVADSLLRRRPAIRYEGPDPQAFGSVVFVAPVWVSRMAGPMRTFIHAQAAGLKRVAVISVMGGSGATHAAAETGHLLGRAPPLSTSFTARDVEDGSYAPRLAAFGRAVQATSDHWPIVHPASWSPSAV